MQKLIDIPGNDPALAATIEAGIFPSLPAKQQKLWLQASNINFGDRSAYKSHGYTLLSSVTGSIRGIAQAFVDGEERAYLGTVDTIYRYANGDTSALREDFTGSRWSMVPWGTWLLATNGVDPPQIWKNAGAMVNWAGVPVDSARIVRKLAQRPILFTGQTAYWPRTTNIEYFTVPDPEGRAGSYFIRDLDSDIVAVEPLGEFLAYYSENKMGLITFVGGQDVYGFKNRLDGIGAMGINCVVPVGQTHFGMSVNGIWRTDGSTFQYIDQPAINRFFDDHLDKGRGDEIVAFHHVDETKVEWHFPGEDEEIHGLTYNYLTGAWSHEHKGITAGASQEIFNYPLVAVANEWGTYGDNSNLGSLPLEASVTTGGFDAGQSMMFKWWDKVQIELEQSGLVEIRFGLHRLPTMGDHADDYWTDWATVTQENWVMKESVYITAQLRSTGLNTTWRIGGISVWGEMAGRVS